MISTNTIKRRVNDAPQKLTVLTTNKVKPKTEADMLASAKLQIEALRPLVNARETRKHTGTMLTTANMEDRKLNEKRRALMAKRKAQRGMNADIRIEPKPKRRGRPKKT